MASEEYLSALEDEIGEFVEIKEWYPGVYYISASQDKQFFEEYYAVMDDSPMAEKVRNYGEKRDGLRLFEQADDSSGWRVVQYEISKYRITEVGEPTPEWLFRDMTLHAMELHPEYFGVFPVPFHTPHGYTLRYRTLDNGVYWLETSECKELLAVCFPIWNAELSPVAAVCGKKLEPSWTAGIEKPTEYRFFSQELSCVPLYELMETRRKWEGTVIDRSALMNAIWKYAPVYAMHLNGQHPPGLNTACINFLEESGCEVMPQSNGKDVFGMFPDAGMDYLLLK